MKIVKEIILTGMFGFFTGAFWSAVIILICATPTKSFIHWTILMGIGFVISGCLLLLRRKNERKRNENASNG